MEEEGLHADDIVVTKLEAAPSKTRETIQVDDDFDFTKFQNDYNRNKENNEAAPEIKTKSQTIEMENVIVNFHTIGKPSENAAAFASGVASSQEQVSSDIQYRMRSNGLRTSGMVMRAEPSFEKIVEDSVEVAKKQKEPGIITTMQPAPKIGKKIDCDFSPVDYFTSERKQETVLCESACIDFKIVNIMGGKDGVFNVHSPPCISAYYIKLIGEEGGALEIMHMGPDDNLEVPEDAIDTRGMLMVVFSTKDMKTYRVTWDTYRIKKPGPRVVPTTPKPATVPRFSPRYTEATDNPWVATSTRLTPHSHGPAVYSDRSFIVMQNQICCDGYRPEYNQVGSEARTKLESMYLEQVAKLVDDICGESVVTPGGVSIINLEKVQGEPDAALITFNIKCDTQKTAKCIKGMEAQVSFQKMLDFRGKYLIGAVTSTRYGRGLEEQLSKEVDSSGGHKHTDGGEHHHHRRRRALADTKEENPEDTKEEGVADTNEAIAYKTLAEKLGKLKAPRRLSLAKMCKLHNTSCIGRDNSLLREESLATGSRQGKRAIADSDEESKADEEAGPLIKEPGKHRAQGLLLRKLMCIICNPKDLILEPRRHPHHGGNGDHRRRKRAATDTNEEATAEDTNEENHRQPTKATSP